MEKILGVFKYFPAQQAQLIEAATATEKARISFQRPAWIQPVLLEPPANLPPAVERLNTLLSELPEELREDLTAEVIMLCSEYRRRAGESDVLRRAS